MPLQIRRGPTVDRESIRPLAGELVYDTTTGAVFIGDGNTMGGVPVTNISIADVRNATAEQFLGPAFTDNTLHSGITFQYVDNRLIATVSNELSGNFSGNFFAEDSALIIDGATGTVYGPFIGSVFSENSSLLVNAGNSSINLDGTVKGNIIPDESESYDIGSPSSKFKDLYLSGSSLWLGDAQLTASGISLVLPTGSTIDGNPLGIELGQEYEIDIKGDVRGSVFPDDSSIPTNPEDPDDSTRTQPLVDAINSSINLNGTVKGNIIPDLSETHNIGSLTKKFNKLYLTESESSLWIGNAAIGSTGTSIDLPAGSTVGGIAIGSGTGSGVVDGSNYKINIVSGDDSTLLVDSDNGRLFGTFSGNVIGGDISGGSISALTGYFTDNITAISTTPDKRLLSLESYYDNIEPSSITFKKARGTIESQLPVITDDRLGSIQWNAWTGTSNFTTSILRSVVEGTVSSTAVPTRMEFLTSDDDGNLRRGGFFNRLGEFVTEFANRQILNVFNTDPTHLFAQHHDTPDARLFVFNRSRGTSITPTPVQDNDFLGSLVFQGYRPPKSDPLNVGQFLDDGAFNIAAAIRVITGGVDGEGVRGGFQFQTFNGVNLANRLVITTAGRVNIFNGIGLTGVITPNLSNGDINLDTLTQGSGTVNFNAPVQTTVGAAGAAAALPASPTTYLRIKISGVEYLIPAFAVS